MKYDGEGQIQLNSLRRYDVESKNCLEREEKVEFGQC